MAAIRLAQSTNTALFGTTARSDGLDRPTRYCLPHSSVADFLTSGVTCMGIIALPQLAAAKVSKSNFGQNSGNFVDISKAFFEMVIWKFESCPCRKPNWADN